MKKLLFLILTIPFISFSQGWSSPIREEDENLPEFYSCNTNSQKTTLYLYALDNAPADGVRYGLKFTTVNLSEIKIEKITIQFIIDGKTKNYAVRHILTEDSEYEQSGYVRIYPDFENDEFIKDLRNSKQLNLICGSNTIRFNNESIELALGVIGFGMYLEDE